MKRLLLILLFACTGLPSLAVEAGRFQTLTIKAPAEQPLGLAFVISDISGWDAATEKTAAALQQDGWLAVGLDLRKYRETLQRDDDTCHDVGDELIDLSQHLQRERGMTTYLTPVIVGFGQGGVLAYAAIRQALPASFTAGAAIGAGNRLDLPQSLCDGPRVKKITGGYRYDMTQSLRVPFDRDTSLDRLVAGLRPYQRNPATDKISDLPLVPLPSPANPVHAPASDVLVIFLSGDGGWRDLDKTIAERLNKQGVAIVGWDSLRYFWKRKTPEQLASDLGRVIAHYGQLWHKPRVALVGYSFGADAIPFAYNRLPAAQQKKISLMALLGLGKQAAFEIEVGGYIGLNGANDLPLAPELARLPDHQVVCLYGREDAGDSSCPSLQQWPQVRVIATQGGHHFDNDYDWVATQLLSAIK